MCSLLPLHDYIVGGGRDPAGLTLLEVGCGTGRFHTFVKVGAAAGRLRCYATHHASFAA